MDDYRRTPYGKIAMTQQRAATSVQRMRDAVAQLKNTALPTPQRPVRPALPQRPRMPVVAQPQDAQGGGAMPNPEQPAVYSPAVSPAVGMPDGSKSRFLPRQPGDSQWQLFGGNGQGQITYDAMGRPNIVGDPSARMSAVVGRAMVTPADEVARRAANQKIVDEMMAKAQGQSQAADTFGAESLVNPDVMAQEMGASGRTRYSETAQTGRNSLNQAAETMRHITPSGNVDAQTQSAQDIAKMEEAAAMERYRAQAGESEKDRSLKREETAADRNSRERMQMAEQDRQARVAIATDKNLNGEDRTARVDEYTNQQGEMATIMDEMRGNPAFKDMSPLELQANSERYKRLRDQQQAAWSNLANANPDFVRLSIEQQDKAVKDEMRRLASQQGGM